MDHAEKKIHNKIILWSNFENLFKVQPWRIVITRQNSYNSIYEKMVEKRSTFIINDAFWIPRKTIFDSQICRWLTFTVYRNKRTLFREVIELKSLQDDGRKWFQVLFITAYLELLLIPSLSVIVLVQSSKRAHSCVSLQ